MTPRMVAQIGMYDQIDNLTKDTDDENYNYIGHVQLKGNLFDIKDR